MTRGEKMTDAVPEREAEEVPVRQQAEAREAMGEEVRLEAEAEEEVGPPGPLVLVLWEDTTNCAHWSDPDDVRDWTNFSFDHTCASVGWVVRDSDDALVLVAQRTVDNEQFAMTSRIPRGTIVRVIDLREESYAD